MVLSMTNPRTNPLTNIVNNGKMPKKIPRDMPKNDVVALFTKMNIVSSGPERSEVLSIKSFMKGNMAGAKISAPRIPKIILNRKKIIKINIGNFAFLR